MPTAFHVFATHTEPTVKPTLVVHSPTLSSMHLLGRNLSETKPVRIALTTFYGISHHTADRLLARLSIHYHCLVQDLTENQVTALSSYLSSPSTSTKPSPTPLAVPGRPEGSDEVVSFRPSKLADPLDSLKIETDLKRAQQADVGRLRQIGTYRGKRCVLHDLWSLIAKLTPQSRARLPRPWSTYKIQCPYRRTTQQRSRSNILHVSCFLCPE
jgi:small subunit ribosomal protein S13